MIICFFLQIPCLKKLFKDIDSEKIELNIRKSRTKYDYEKILKKLETEVKLINDNIDQMYVDKLNGKIHKSTKIT